MQTHRAAPHSPARAHHPRRSTTLASQAKLAPTPSVPTMGVAMPSSVLFLVRRRRAPHRTRDLAACAAQSERPCLASTRLNRRLIHSASAVCYAPRNARVQAALRASFTRRVTRLPRKPCTLCARLTPSPVSQANLPLTLRGHDEHRRAAFGIPLLGAPQPRALPHARPCRVRCPA